jgi:asparagine N-glycosylation enzyme membrane subunit Stt3
VAIIGIALRRRAPALTLLAVWSVTMIAGVILQLRMAAYTGFVVAILAGCTCTWIVRSIPVRHSRLRAGTAAILILIALAAALPVGIAQTGSSEGPDPDWAAALNWMRWNTPEPMGDPLAWYRWWPRIEPPGEFVYPPSAYGVIVPWDHGPWISAIARRIPAANAELNGAVQTARFLTETDPDDALQYMRKDGQRYAAIGPGELTFDLPSLVKTAGRRFERYSRMVYLPLAGGRRVPARIYLPDFFRSMAGRLYLFDGRRIEAAKGVSVFLTSLSVLPSGSTEETVLSVHAFASEKEAEQWLAFHPEVPAILASADPTESCVDLDAIPWMTRVFVSRNEQLRSGTQPAAVKIFERAQ